MQKMKEDQTYFGTPDHINILRDAFIAKGKELSAAPESAVIAVGQLAALLLVESGMNTITVTSDHCVVEINLRPPKPTTMEA